MSDLALSNPQPMTDGSIGYSHSPVPPPSVDVMALTRALVFTKETYRTLRSKAESKAEVVDLEAVARAARVAIESPTLTHARLPETHVSDRALTPWDMIDEEPSPAGVEFTGFQQRARDAAREMAA